MKKSREKPGEILRLNLLQLLKANNINEIPNDIPTKWERHGDLILIPSHSLQHAVWVGLGCIVWDTVAQSLACERIARKHRIVNDDLRSPCTELLRGSDRWVTRVDNGIKCTFDVTKCMFSAGNITEKLRIAKLPCENEVVVDLYAGDSSIPVMTPLVMASPTSRRLASLTSRRLTSPTLRDSGIPVMTPLVMTPLVMTPPVMASRHQDLWHPRHQDLWSRPLASPTSRSLASTTSRSLASTTSRSLASPT